MTLDYSTTVSGIKSYLDKYKNKISNDDYLAIIRELDSVENEISERISELQKCSSAFESQSSELEQQTHNAKYWKSTCENISKLPFKEKIKILFKK